MHPLPYAADTERFARAPGVLAREGEFGVVVLGPRAATAVTIEGTGAVLWELLSVPRTESALVAELVSRFPADVEQVRGDVSNALELLVDHGAVERYP